MTTLNIREATPKDVEVILNFITELAIYEREPDAVLADKSHIHDTLFCAAPKVFGLICEQPGAEDSAPVAIGFAIYFFNYSTWLGQHGLYLEDLYVTPEARGLGAGKSLLKTLAKIALDNNCGRYEWNVLRWNTPAIEFYESCGARPLSEWVGYRMDRQAMEKFALSDD